MTEGEKKKMYNHLRKNPWIVSTIILGLVVSFVMFNNITAGISKEAAGEYLISYFEDQGATGLSLDSVGEEEGFYKVVVDYQGSDLPFYVTKNGYLMGNTLYTIIPMTGNAVKTDKPKVGLYIWSYCPYGVTALEPFAQVATLLEDYADFKVYLYYAGHGDFEVQQNKIQACIQELGYEGYWDYAETFASIIYQKCSNDVDCDLKESASLMDSLGIDSSKVLTCVETDGESLLEEHSNSAREFGVTGSPSLIINGVKANVDRNAESFKSSICEAFSDAPEECLDTLSTSSGTASGSC